jgi:hypothetical protein
MEHGASRIKRKKWRSSASRVIALDRAPSCPLRCRCRQRDGESLTYQRNPRALRPRTWRRHLTVRVLGLNELEVLVVGEEITKSTSGEELWFLGRGRRFSITVRTRPGVRAEQDEAIGQVRRHGDTASVESEPPL